MFPWLFPWVSHCRGLEPRFSQDVYRGPKVQKKWIHGESTVNRRANLDEYDYIMLHMYTNICIILYMLFICLFMLTWLIYRLFDMFKHVLNESNWTSFVFPFLLHPNHPETHLEIPRYLPRICRAMQCSHSQRASEVGLSMSHRVMVKPRCGKSGAKAQRPHIVTVQLWFCAYKVLLQLFQCPRKIQLSTYWQRWREIYQSFRRVSEELIWNETPIISSYHRCCKSFWWWLLRLLRCQLGTGSILQWPDCSLSWVNHYSLDSIQISLSIGLVISDSLAFSNALALLNWISDTTHY